MGNLIKIGFGFNANYKSVLNINKEQLHDRPQNVQIVRMKQNRSITVEWFV